MIRFISISLEVIYVDLILCFHDAGDDDEDDDDDDM